MLSVGEEGGWQYVPVWISISFHSLSLSLSSYRNDGGVVGDDLYDALVLAKCLCVSSYCKIYDMRWIN